MIKSTDVRLKSMTYFENIYLLIFTSLKSDYPDESGGSSNQQSIKQGSTTRINPSTHQGKHLSSNIVNKSSTNSASSIQKPPPVLSTIPAKSTASTSLKYNTLSNISQLNLSALHHQHHHSQHQPTSVAVASATNQTLKKSKTKADLLNQFQPISHQYPPLYAAHSAYKPTSSTSSSTNINPNHHQLYSTLSNYSAKNLLLSTPTTNYQHQKLLSYNNNNTVKSAVLTNYNLTLPKKNPYKFIANQQQQTTTGPQYIKPKQQNQQTQTVFDQPKQQQQANRQRSTSNHSSSVKSHTSSTTATRTSASSSSSTSSSSSSAAAPIENNKKQLTSNMSVDDPSGQNNGSVVNANMVSFRDPREAPLRKLSVDLIKTYKHINEVRLLEIM